MKSLVWNILVLSLVYFASGAAAEQSCAAPPSYPHTELSEKYAGKRSFGDGQKVYYKCAQDFTASSGSRTAQCRNGRWSRLTMKCKKKTCGNAGELAYGQYEYEGDAYIGEKVYAKCNKGYTLRGPSYRICKASGWTSDIPTCEVGEPTCPHPAVSNSASGAPAATDYQVGQSLSFTCSQGFRLDGAQQITCGAGGRWQPEPPRCLPLSAATNVPPTTGREASRVPATTGSEDATVQREKEAAPPSATGECGVPPAVGVPQASLASKYVSMTLFASGYRVHYVCDVGYQQASGSRYRKCVDGTWTPLQLRCEKKLCGSAGEILNGQFTYTGVEFGDTARAACDRGYRLVGRATRNCMSRGWDGRVPVCEVVDCDEPPVVKDADMEGSEDGTYTYANTVRYRCRVGTLVGPQEVWCTENGTWSATPTCQQITCPSPDSPGAFWAGVPKESYDYRDTITIECQPGYRVTGANVVSCGEDGRWHPQPPRCARVARQVPWRG